MGSNLWPIFLGLLFIGYVVLFLIHVFRRTGERREVVMKETVMRKEPAGKVKRLYRSGNDRILGGVCGGIAEYLEVDPVVIRLLWIIGSLAWGFGIILYIIAWIIIPRNPKHKWD